MEADERIVMVGHRGAGKTTYVSTPHRSGRERRPLWTITTHRRHVAHATAQQRLEQLQPP